MSLNQPAYIVKGNHKKILQYQYPIHVKEVIILILLPFGFKDEPAGKHHA
jgi:hypothetical protein